MVPASIMEICAHWAPPEERSRIIVCSIVGVYLGTAYSYPLCGLVAKLFGWPAIFYVSGKQAGVPSIYERKMGATHEAASVNF